MKCPYTKEEKEIMHLLTEAHNKFMKLETTHTSEKEDWCRAFHLLQSIICMRILRRDYPEEFITIKK